MTDPNNTPAGAGARPKKLSFFKKAAWQATVKTEEEEQDMFSHSREFRDILAEDTQRKKQEWQKGGKAKKRKPQEIPERKIRKMQKMDEAKRRKAEEDPEKMKLERKNRMKSNIRSKSYRTPERETHHSHEHETHHSPERGTHRSPDRETHPSPNRTMSRSPDRPTPVDSLVARYDSLTKSSSSNDRPSNAKQAYVIDVDDDDVIFNYETSPSLAKQAVPICSKRAVSPLLEEVEDPTIAALQAKARARAAEREAANSPACALASNGPKPKSAVVQLLISSLIPNTKPLLVKVRTTDMIDKLRGAWCARQGFSPEMSRNVFITFKNRKQYNTTQIHRLGLHVDDNGCVTVEGDPNIYDDTNLPKVAIDAWTEEVYQQWKKEEAEEAAAKKAAAVPPPIVEDEPPEPTPEPEVTKIRIVMKAKGKEDFKIVVKPDTECGHLASVYKLNRGVPKDQPITLLFDGDRLPPMDRIADTEIEDMDVIEVHFK